MTAAGPPPREFYLYHIENSLDGTMYIGKTAHPSVRKSHHKLRSTNAHLNSAIKKHGWESFTFTLFECYATEEEAYQAEAVWIDNALEYGVKLYNHSAGGRGGTTGMASWNKGTHGLMNIWNKGTKGLMPVPWNKGTKGLMSKTNRLKGLKWEVINGKRAWLDKGGI